MQTVVKQENKPAAGNVIFVKVVKSISRIITGIRPVNRKWLN
jgi:hypothetical protein